jgi:hypothetical protein
LGGAKETAPRETAQTEKGRGRGEPARTGGATGGAPVAGNRRRRAAVLAAMLSPRLLLSLLAVAGGAFAASATSAPAAILEIKNEHIRATLDDATGELTLRKTGTGSSAGSSAGGAVSTGGTGGEKVFASAKFALPVALSSAGTGNTLGTGDGYTLRLVAGEPFLRVTRSARAAGGSVVNANGNHRVAYPAFTLADAAWDVAHGTGGPRPLAKNAGSYQWTAIVNAKSREGVVAGWLTVEKGSGAVLAKVAGNGKPKGDAAGTAGTVGTAGVILPHLDYGACDPAAGGTAPLETLLIGYFADARFGLERYADAVAAELRIKLPPMPTVHCTWYVDAASTEKKLRPRTDFAAAALAPFGMDVIQIDDGWQRGTGGGNGPKKVFGDFDTRGPYPSGMAPVAQHIRDKKFTAGIWLIPFSGTANDPFFADKQDLFIKKRPDKKAAAAAAQPYTIFWAGTCLDMTRPAARDYLAAIIRRLTNEWGYRYLKLDGLCSGLGVNLNYVCDSWREDEFGRAILADPAKTQTEAYRSGLRLVRENAAPGTFILGCCAPQNMRSAAGAYGLVDAMRIGPDNGAAWNALLSGPRYGAWSWFLHGRVWWNDPDPLYVRATLPLAQARAICTYVTLAGFMNSSSEEYAKLPAERLDLLRRTMPSHTSPARPVDVFEESAPAVWHVAGNDGATTLAGLYNWGAWTKTIARPLTDFALDPAAPTVAFDFWENRLLPVFTGELRRALPARSCANLALRQLRPHPQLISTSRHITQGLVDTRDVRWDAAKRTLSGTTTVVAGDPCELRILTLTTGGDGGDGTGTDGTGGVREWSASAAEAKLDGGRTILKTAGSASAGLFRLTLPAEKSGDVQWQITFATGTAAAAASLAALADADTAAQSAATAGAAAAAKRRDPGPVPPAPRVYLDQLNPAAVHSGYGKFCVNKNQSGRPLQLGKQKFAHGILLHAAGEAAYAVPAGSTRFVAIAGIEESKRENAASSLRVRIAYENPVGDRHDLAATPVLMFDQTERWHLDVALPADAVRLIVISDDAGDGNNSDHAVLATAGFL